MENNIGRREFLKRSGVVFGAAAAAPGRGVSLITDPADPVASAAPARWAAKELEQALGRRGVSVTAHARLEQAGSRDLLIVIAGRSAGDPVPDVPEALGLLPSKIGGRPVLRACGGDVRGLVYALLELADRVNLGGDPLAALDIRKAVVEKPANRIRSIGRCFVSDIEDKSWYNDRSMWPDYLSMLAAQRFNRFSLTFGIGYDFPRDVRDCYFHFAYPFLVSVPGYEVRVSGVPDAERDRNLEMLRFIGDATAARGLDFQLALWTHAYEWVDSPRSKYTVQGLTPEEHAPYCRDALRMVLEACPAIKGVTFRVHGESGIPEESFDFWRTVFDGIVRCGRRVEIDMHAKGMDQRMIDVALASGMPVNISPKYWAEHMGLPYHQAGIRELEMPPKEHKDSGVMALSSGSRKFLRYGYGDLLQEKRSYGILHRIWPGTQRVLLWGDPAMAAAYGRASSFCGSSGIEIYEPLSFKGRKGSGLPGGRCAYADSSLQPERDWEKYLYTYRVWGRLLYNPDADPDSWGRHWQHQLRAGASAAESALAHASRILPLVTTAHGLSGSNNTYWPEMYTNMPIVDAGRKHPYSDTPSPKRFGTVSPFDPVLFARVDDFAEELLNGKRGAKCSPLQVAQALDSFARTAAQNMAQAVRQVGTRGGAEFRRLKIDVAMQSGLGRFFACKLRSGVLYAIYERSGERAALEEALKAYRAAREAWSELANRARGVYAPDITYGYVPHMRGHWLDRLPAIDADIDDMAKRLEKAAGKSAEASPAVREVLAAPRRPDIACRHTPPPAFRPGQELPLELAIEGPLPASVRLQYRHVNQAERYCFAEMEARNGRYRAAIPPGYTESPYPLLYFFEVREGPDAAWIYPGFQADFANQPYFVLRQA